MKQQLITWMSMALFSGSAIAADCEVLTQACLEGATSTESSMVSEPSGKKQKTNISTSVFNFFDRASMMINPPPKPENVIPGATQLDQGAMDAMTETVSIAEVPQSNAAAEPPEPEVIMVKTEPEYVQLEPKEEAPEVIMVQTEPTYVQSEPKEEVVAAADTSCAGDSGKKLRFGCKSVKYNSHHLAWSKPSKDEMSWDQAANYCRALTTDGFEDWRLPELREIQTLLTFSEDKQTAINYPEWLPDHVVLWFNRSKPSWGYVWLFRDDTGLMKPYYQGSSYSIFSRQQAFCVRSL